MFKKTLMVFASVMGLAACQTPSTQSTQQSNTPVEPQSLSLTLDKTTVHSWHLGHNAQSESYLLVVLNKATLERLQTVGTHKLKLNLGQHTFNNASSIQGGFLVLHPLPSSWSEKQIASLLN